MRGVWLALSLLLGAGLMRSATVEPRPVAADAPALAFSSSRAMADVRRIAAVPHPVGSPANAQVRDYLIGRMTALDLKPRLQRDAAFAVEADGMAAYGADVENLIGVLPGRDRAAPALALMAHYDSAPGSPGAGDDAAGVAVVLETVRAIRARGVPARDVVVLLTDGEEPDLLGAHAFFERDPAAAHIGLVINLEARGGAGRAAMFETSAQNGGLIAALQGAANHPVAGSLANSIYSRMPNGTDLTVAKRAGKAGVNFAFLGGQVDYHAPTATAANLHEGSVQSMGAQVLPLAARLAFGDLPTRTPDVVFSQVFGSVIAVHPPHVGWLLLAAAFGLAATGAIRARRTAPLHWGDAGLGAVASIGVLGISAGLLWLARAALDIPDGSIWQLPLLARLPLWEAAMASIGALVLVVAARLLARRDGASVWLGALIPAGAAALALQILAPLNAYVVAWPLGVAALSAGATALGRDTRWPARALLAVLAALSLGWLGGLAHFVVVALDQAWLLAAFVWLASLALWPLLILVAAGRAGWIASGVLLACAAALVAFLRFSDPASIRHPQATVAYYVAEPRAGRFWLVAPSGDRSAWAKALLAQGEALPERRDMTPLMHVAQAAAAPAVRTPAYDVTLSQGADCVVTLTAPWAADARALNVRLDLAGPASAATIGSRATDLLRHGHADLAWRRADGGVALTFKPSKSGAVAVRYALILDRWPAAAAPPPPRSARQMAWGDSDALVMLGETHLDAVAC